MRNTKCKYKVYKINCKECDVSYVGQTKRQLATRKEHRRNIKLDPSKYSVISEYIYNFNHLFDWENVKTLDKEENYYKRLVSEMIHIKEQNNEINFQKDTECLDKIYFDILANICKV